jgi:hypothetical protein
VVTETRSPDAQAVNLLAVFEAKVRAEVQAVEGVTEESPVHQITGVQYGQPRQGVHRGAGQVVIRAHTDHVGIGEFVVKQRVRIGPVAVVGHPRGAALARVGPPATMQRRQEGVRGKSDSAYLLQIDLQNLNCVTGHHVLYALALDARGGLDGGDALGMRD